jgi:ParB-like chromosome segregation protein Spo0J
MEQKVNPADKVERWKIERLVPYARNARTHSDEQVAQIAASIREWGWTTPVLVDEDGGIIAGHGRTLAAQRLQMAEVPVMVARGWSDAKKRAYILADNKLALNAGWENELLNLELSELKELDFDLELIGFSADEIAALQMPDFAPATEEEQGKLDELDPKWIACPHCGKEFDARQA